LAGTGRKSLPKKNKKTNIASHLGGENDGVYFLLVFRLVHDMRGGPQDYSLVSDKPEQLETTSSSRTNKAHASNQVLFEFEFEMKEKEEGGLRRFKVPALLPGLSFSAGSVGDGVLLCNCIGSDY
jgi:hypothetical protein